MSKTEGHERVPEELKIVPAKFQVNPTSFVRVTMGGGHFWGFNVHYCHSCGAPVCMYRGEARVACTWDQRALPNKIREVDTWY